MKCSNKDSGAMKMIKLDEKDENLLPSSACLSQPQIDSWLKSRG
jgi:hypothetical protein